MRKCHPAIFELAALWKEHIQGLNALGDNPSIELVSVLEARTEKRLEEIQREYSNSAPCVANAVCVFSKAALTSKVGEQGMVEGLHWLRHKIPLWRDVERMESRDGKAARRVLQTGAEYEALRCDHEKPKPFKGDLEHFTMFQYLWDFGIGNLSAEALADFFDDFCACGAEHDPDALRKQRARFQRDLSLPATSK